MREVDIHGTARGGFWLCPNVCVRAIGIRCRWVLNRQGSEVENLVRVTPESVRDADRQTDRSAFTKIENQFCILIIRLHIHVHGKTTLYFQHFGLLSDETAEADVSDQRGRRKTAELHTSGAKRDETRRGWVK